MEMIVGLRGVHPFVRGSLIGMGASAVTCLALLILVKISNHRVCVSLQNRVSVSVSVGIGGLTVALLATLQIVMLKTLLERSFA